MRLFLILLAGSLSLFRVSAQDIPSLPELSTQDLPAAQFTRNDIFDGSSLWGYMNGGADLYLEYGFSELRIQEFVIDGEELKVELFRMDDAASAYGIYSIKIFKCKQTGLYTKHDCLGNYQYQAQKGCFYLSVINSSGTAKAGELSKMTAKKCLDKIKGQPFDITAFETKRDELSGDNQLIFIRGKLGIQNSIPRWTDMFRGVESFEVCLLNIRHKKDKLTLAELHFEAPEACDKFIAQNVPETEKKNEIIFFSKQGKNFGILRSGKQELRLFECKTETANWKSTLREFGF